MSSEQAMYTEWVLTVRQRWDMEQLEPLQAADYVEARDLGLDHDQALECALDVAIMEALREAKY